MPRVFAWKLSFSIDWFGQDASRQKSCRKLAHEWGRLIVTTMSGEVEDAAMLVRDSSAIFGNVSSRVMVQTVGPVVVARGTVAKSMCECQEEFGDLIAALGGGADMTRAVTSEETEKKIEALQSVLHQLLKHIGFSTKQLETVRSPA